MSPRPPSPRVTAAPPRRRWAAPVSVLLVAVAVLPLLGASMFALRELGQVAESRSQAASVRDQTGEVVALAELRVLLLDERNWMQISIGAEAVGIDHELVEKLTGVDLPARLSEARAVVDARVAALELDDLAAQLAALRGDNQELPPLDRFLAQGRAYSDLEAMYSERTDALFDELTRDAGDADGGGDLVDAVRELQWSIEARQSVASLLTTYYATAFSTGDDRRAGVELLTAQRAIYQRSIADLSRAARAGSPVDQALDDVMSSPDQARFVLAVDEIIVDRLGVDDPEATAAELSVGQVLDAGAVFEAGAATAVEHSTLVEAATAQIEAAGESLSAAASAATTRLWVMIASVAVASVLLAVVAARFVVAPLQRMAGIARFMRDGGDRPDGRASGPREVQIATEALNGALENLEVATRQARSLAAGELDAPVLHRPASGQLGTSLQEAVQTLASSLGEREEFRRRLAHEATHDGMTQLPNRTACLAHLTKGLARTARNGSSLAVLFVDLDGFKEVNDHHGHHAGDTVLRAVAQRLVTSVREGDHVGRLGGDEFLVIAEPVGDVADAVRLARRLVVAIAEPIDVDGTAVSVNACVGVAVAADDGLDADELLRDADLAVYKAKQQGRGTIELCDEALRTELVERVNLEQSLADAIINDELELHYQPTIDPATGLVAEVEALVRWRRPGFGLIPPDEFIPQAERSDLINELDRWVVTRAVRQLDEWRNDPVLGDAAVAVNISGRHLMSDDLVDDILRPLDGRQVDPSRLVVEVTESALLDDLDNAAHKLQRLRDRGVRVAIDDFGTGYTSLAHLRTLPIDILKIDRSFTGDVSSESLVQLIIDTGHLLGVEITAEGVETGDQAVRLARMGSDTLQGFLYGRPCPPDELRAMLSETSLTI